MQRVALTPEQIRRLSDTYQEAVDSREFAIDYDPAQPTRPFLPELFRADGPWVCLSGYSSGPTASGQFTGRARFLILCVFPVDVPKPSIMSAAFVPRENHLLREMATLIYCSRSFL